MKKLIFIAVIVILISCSSTRNNYAGHPTPAGEGWRISNEEYKDLKERLNECGLFRRCRTPEYVDTNLAQYNYVKDSCPTCTITFETVRYRHKDQDRYGKLWGISHKKDSINVRGYSTMILRVSTINKSDSAANNPTTFYYAIRICPPPRSCKPPIDKSHL